MSTLVKTPEQIELVEIWERLESEFNQSKADVARALGIERSYVSMLIKCDRKPSARTLQQFRDLEVRLRSVRAQGPAAETHSSDFDNLVNRLALMEQHDPANYQVAKKVIESLAPEINSDVKRAADNALKRASAALHKRGADQPS